MIQLRKKERQSYAERARHLGKSARTRARIIDTAVRMIAQSGFEAATANEIAREADIAHGTFYLHFRDKEELSQAVALEIGREVVAQLDMALEGVTDAIERSSWATRRFVEYATGHEEVGWALYRAIWSRSDLRERALDYLRADLKRGVAQGVFKVEVDDLLLGVFISMLASALLEGLSGRSGRECGSRVAELQLRMLGVPHSKAKKIAWREVERFDANVSRP